MKSVSAKVPLVSTHTHTNLSLCGWPEMTFEAVVGTAVELGFALLVLCDHVHVPAVTHYSRHLDRLRQYRECRDRLQAEVEIAVGGEFEVAAPGQVVADECLVAACESVIVAPNHYQLDWVMFPRGNASEVASHELDAIETAIDWPPTEVVAHPFAATGLAYSPNELYRACDKGRLRDLFARARERRIAFEIQPKFWYDPWRADRLAEFFESWLELGGKVALGSDAHTLSSLRVWADHYGELVERFALTGDCLWWPGQKGTRETAVPPISPP